MLGPSERLTALTGEFVVSTSGTLTTETIPAPNHGRCKEPRHRVVELYGNFKDIRRLLLD